MTRCHYQISSRFQDVRYPRISTEKLILPGFPGRVGTLSLGQLASSRPPFESSVDTLKVNPTSSAPPPDEHQPSQSMTGDPPGDRLLRRRERFQSVLNTEFSFVVHRPRIEFSVVWASVLCVFVLRLLSFQSRAQNIAPVLLQL